MRTLLSRHRPAPPKERFRLTADGEGSPGLRDYLQRTDLEIVDLSSESSFDLSVAHCPRLTLALLSTPPIRMFWRRDRHPPGRSAVIFARVGSLSAATRGPAVQRGESAVLIPPGDEPVEIMATHARNELIYISASASVMPSVVAQLTHTLRGPAVPWSRVAPLYAFVSTACASPAHAADDTDPVASSAEAITSAFAIAILGDLERPDSIVERVRAFIDENHTHPDLTSAAIAAHFGVAQRTLQTAFAAEGSTIRQELRDARRRTALTLREQHPDMLQSRRAQLSGFSSLSAMYRAVGASPDEPL